MFGIPMIVITLALVFYSIGVWSERLAGKLKSWHLVFFWLGFICDTWGTGMMLEMAEGMTFNFHGLTGLLAIVLMFVHATWQRRFFSEEMNDGYTIYTNSVWLFGESGLFHILDRLFSAWVDNSRNGLDQIRKIMDKIRMGNAFMVTGDIIGN